MLFHGKKMKEIVITFIIALVIVNGTIHTYKCQLRFFGFGSFVCVCNSTFCGSIPETQNPRPGSYHWYTTSRSGERLHLTIGKINQNNPSFNRSILIINHSSRLQKVDGFGGSFTDSSGINLGLLSAETQHQLMEAYFGRGGSRYNLGRVPIAGSDFSTRGYTYNDVENDTELKTFSLEREDYEYKIPMMRAAIKMNPDLKFVAAAWTAPPWMKSAKDFGGFGFLRPEYYQTYANYLIKFLDAYKKFGISFWSISTGNEPTLIPEYPFNLSSMSWTTPTASKWIAENLGPTLAKSQHTKTGIYCFDDQRSFLPHHAQMLFENKEVRKYIMAIGVHWYKDNITDPKVLDKTHVLFPEKRLWVTEACLGSDPREQPKARLGSWDRAEYYIYKMIENINHWVSGWIDWNLVLDRIGGPNWIDNYVDSPIIVNPEKDEFFKNPMFYAIKHFSRFVPRGSSVLKISRTPQIKATAFSTPEGNNVIVLCNLSKKEENMSIRFYRKNSIDVTLPARSFNTIIYRRRSSVL